MASQETKKIKITQIRSIIDSLEKQKRTMRALGIRKMHQSVIHKATPQILGMATKVRHLVRVEEVK
jgi:large subunit ribosomal protein L30